MQVVGFEKASSLSLATGFWEITLLKNAWSLIWKSKVCTNGYVGFCSLAPAGDIITVAKQKKHVHVYKLSGRDVSTSSHKLVIYIYIYIHVHVHKLSGRDVSTSSHKLAIYIHWEKFADFNLHSPKLMNVPFLPSFLKEKGLDHITSESFCTWLTSILTCEVKLRVWFLSVSWSY